MPTLQGDVHSLENHKKLHSLGKIYSSKFCVTQLTSASVKILECILILDWIFRKT